MLRRVHLAPVAPEAYQDTAPTEQIEECLRVLGIFEEYESPISMRRHMVVGYRNSYAQPSLWNEGSAWRWTGSSSREQPLLRGDEESA